MSLFIQAAIEGRHCFNSPPSTIAMAMVMVMVMVMAMARMRMQIQKMVHAEDVS